MKTTKTILHIFDASAFDEELGLLNEMSEKGWQLANMRFFSQKYVWDDSVVYRYAVDYQYEFSVGEFKQYRTEFEDQGWEYVTKNNDWYVFRKPYDPSLPEEEYLIYTDEPSFRDMKSKIVMGVNLFAIMYLPNILMTPSLVYLLLILATLVITVGGIFRRLRLKRVRCVPKRYRFHLWRHSYGLAILILILSVLYMIAGDVTRDFHLRGPTVGVQSAEFDVAVPEYFGMELYYYWEDFQEIPDEPDVLRAVFTITDKDGRLVDSGLLSTEWREVKNIFLRPGRYTLTVDWGEGPDRPHVEAHIGYPGSLVPDSYFRYGFYIWCFGWATAYVILHTIDKRKHGHSTWI